MKKQLASFLVTAVLLSTAASAFAISEINKSADIEPIFIPISTNAQQSKSLKQKVKSDVHTMKEDTKAAAKKADTAVKRETQKVDSGLQKAGEDIQKAANDTEYSMKQGAKKLDKGIKQGVKDVKTPTQKGLSTFKNEMNK